MIEWQFKISVSGSKYHSRLYRGMYKGKGVQHEIHTPVIGYFEFGEPEHYFFIDGDPREFRTEADLIKAIDEGAKAIENTMSNSAN